MKFLLICVSVFLQFVRAESILCYNCDDSTDDRDYADCIYHVRRLAFQRHLHETGDRSLDQLEFIKNCSKIRDPITGEEVFKYCSIEIIQSFGSTNAYLRGCSTGTNFASLNVTRLRNPRPDNQTTCGFSQLQGATQCIQLCDEDFCNGPFSSPGHRVFPSMSLAVMSMVSALTCYAMI